MSSLPLERQSSTNIDVKTRRQRISGDTDTDRTQMRRWFEVSADPNNPVLMRGRQRYLARIRRRELINDRVAYLCRAVAGKNVLDVGCVDHYSESEAEKREDWLHGALCRSAASCLGVDVLESEVNKLCARGYNVVCRNLIENPLDQEFDVIVCGEVFEHVGTPEQLLRSLANMLRPEGKLILTVPNPFYMNVLLKNMFEGRPFVDNVDHILWYDPSTFLELGQRCDLLLSRYAGILSQESDTFAANTFFRMRGMMTRAKFRPEVFAKSMLYEFVPQFYRANHR